MKHEISSLTGLRGVAAFYVMIFHYMNSFFITHYEIDPTISNLILKNIVAHGYLAVDLFFMLSAFVLTLRYKDAFKEKVAFNSYWNFMKKRFRRLYPVYFLCVLCTMLLFKNYSIFIFLELFFLNAFSDVNLYNFNIATWSLSIEWTVYLFFPFLLLIFQKFSKVHHILLFIFSIFLLYYIQTIQISIFSVRTFSIDEIRSNNNLNIHFGFPALLRGFLAYYLGYLIFKYHKYLNKKILFFFSIVVLFATMIFNYNDIFILISFMLFFAGILKENVISKFLQISPVKYLGEISYSLYLFHIVIFNLMQKYDWGLIKINTLPFFLITIVLSLIFAVFSYEIFEKRLAKILFTN